MPNDDPLLSMRWHSHPLGFTRPGFLPIACIGPHGSLIAQHHEALHYQLNVLTTLGNSLTLLMQISEKCTGKLAETALEVATKWNDAQVYQVEGLINYACYKRVKRRMPELAVEYYEQMLPNVYHRGWRESKAAFDNLNISEGSKDALAMHVAVFGLNLPVYEFLRDLKSLHEIIHIVTRESLDERFKDIQHALLSKFGGLLLTEWDARMLHLWTTDLPEAEKQKLEASAADELLRKLVPHIDTIPREGVVNSIALAEAWNTQLEQQGFSAICKIAISEGDYADGLNEVAINPLAPSITGLHSCEDARQIIELLESDQAIYGLGIVHCEGDEIRTISRKYKRILRKGDIYIRFSFVRPTPDCERYDILSVHLFTIISKQEMAEYFSHLKHPHLVLTQSAASSEILEFIALYSQQQPEQVWRIHWGKPMSWIINHLRNIIDRAQWISCVVMLNSYVGFILAKSVDAQWLDVYPLAWDARKKIFAEIEEYRIVSQEVIDRKMIYSILGALIDLGF